MKTEKQKQKESSKKAEIQKYANEHNLSFTSASEILKLLERNTFRKKCICEIHDRLNCSWSKAEYVYGKIRDNQSYKQVAKDKGWNYNELTDYTISPNPEALGGWDVYRKGVLVNLNKIKAHKDSTVPHLYVVEYLGRKDNKDHYKRIPLAAIVYVKLRMQNVPFGYVVDHIDNNPLNNNITNLQILTRSQNVRKNAVGHNQFIKKGGK